MFPRSSFIMEPGSITSFVHTYCER